MPKKSNLERVKCPKCTTRLLAEAATVKRHYNGSTWYASTYWCPICNEVFKVENKELGL